MDTTIIISLASALASSALSLIIPLSIKSFAKKYLQKKINEVNSGTEFQNLKKEIATLRQEIRILRGKDSE